MEIMSNQDTQEQKISIFVLKRTLTGKG